MALASSTLPQAQIDAAAQHGLTVVAANAVANAVAGPTWSITGDISGEDQTLASLPAERAFDGRLDLGWGMASDPGGTFEAYVTIPATDVDFAAVYLSRIEPGSTWDVFLDFSNNTAFTGATDTITVASWLGIDAPGRLVQDRLTDTVNFAGSFRRFTGLQYARLRFVESGASTNQPPYIGEWFLGRQLQLSRTFKAPWDDQPYGAEYEETVSWNRRRSRYARAVGFQDHSASYGFAQTQLDRFGLDDHATLRTLRTECQAGLVPLWFHPRADSDWLFGVIDSDWVYAIRDYDSREWQFDFLEDPPFAATE